MTRSSILGLAASSVLKKTTLGQLKGELSTTIVQGGSVDTTSVPASPDITDIDGFYIHKTKEISKLTSDAQGAYYSYDNSAPTGVGNYTLVDPNNYSETLLRYYWKLRIKF